MSSLYLNKLSREQREELVATLLSSQNGNCFVCGKTVDLAVHGNSADIDHIEPIKVGGKDVPENFAVTHDSCNRMKKASDLRVARILASFDQIAESISEENRAPNLGDMYGTLSSVLPPVLGAQPTASEGIDSSLQEMSSCYSSKA